MRFCVVVRFGYSLVFAAETFDLCSEVWGIRADIFYRMLDAFMQFRCRYYTEEIIGHEKRKGDFYAA